MTQQMQEATQQRQAPLWSFDRTGRKPLIGIALRDADFRSAGKYAVPFREALATALDNVTTNGVRVEMREVITEDGYRRTEAAITELRLVLSEDDINAPGGRPNEYGSR